MLVFRFFRLLLITVVLAACASGPVSDLSPAQRAELVDTRIKLAIGYMQQEKLDIALDNVEKALAIDKHSADANHTMALIQWRYKNYHKTQRFFERALDANPDDGNTQHNYAQFLCEQGKPNKAIKHFDNALANTRYQTPLQANLNAGMCLVKSGMPLKGKQYFRAALSLQKNQPVALYHMALIHYDTGNTLSARAYIQQFFSSAKRDTPEALLLAVKIERKLGGKDAERRYARRLSANFPESAQAKMLSTR